jgi:hypothetical protein
MILGNCSVLLYIAQILLIPFTCRADALRPYLSAARWIPLGINMYANLTAVFFSGMQQDPEDEDITEPSEMYVYAP